MYASKVWAASVVRLDDRYISQRNIPGRPTLANRSIVVVGCGTIGGYLADLLVKAGAGSGAGRLTLVDFETLAPQNLGRHLLGFEHLFQNKAEGLASEMRRRMPGVNVNPLPVDVELANLDGVELVIDATGEEALGNWIASRFSKENAASVLSVWIAGTGVAVRALLRKDEEAACYRCLMDANRLGEFRTVVGELPVVHAGQGCEGLYVPFAATAAVQAACLAADMASAWAGNETVPTLQSKLLDRSFELATPDCFPLRRAGCPACNP